MITRKVCRTCCVALLIIVGLVGCATSRLPQKAELAAISQISEGQFEDVSRCNFASVSYGRAGQQTMRPGVIATTPDTFFIFRYQSKTDSFQTAFSLPYRDIQCVTTVRESTGKGVTSILTKDEVISVAAFLPDNDGMNFEAVENMLSKFKSKGILILDAKSQVLSPFLSYSTYVQNPCQPPTIIPRKTTNSRSNEPASIRALEQPVDLFPNIWTTVLAVDGKKIDSPVSERKKPLSIAPGQHQLLLYRSAGKYSSQAQVTVDIAPGQILQIRSEFRGGEVYLWLEDASTGELVSPKTIAP